MGDEQKSESITERISIAGDDLVDKIKGLIEEGNVRRLIIRKPGGETLMEIPLTAGVAVSGVLAVMAPVLAAVGAMAALVTKFEVDIVRSDEDESSD